MLVFRAHPLKSLVTAALFTAFMTAGDSIFILGFAALTQQDINVALQNPYLYYVFCYAAKMVELLGILILKLCMHGRGQFQAATWRDWVRTVMFPVMSVIIVVLLMQFYATDEASAPRILLCSVILVLSDVLAITLLNYLEQQQQTLHDYTILKHSVKLEQDNVTAWMNAYNNQRKQTHEFQHQLSAIYGLVQKEAPNGELARYVSRLLQTDLSDALFVKTGRTVVDVVLNQKHGIAQSKGIALQVQLDDLRNFAVPDDWLVVILSNLIDNAIEACEKIEEPAQRIIRLRMQVAPEAHFLYVDNPTAQPVQIVNNQVVSTKKDGLEHGYGLKNIATILDQLDAIYAIDYQAEQHLFRFSAQFVPQE
jgi:signal transduction histidine kinase